VPDDQPYVRLELLQARRVLAELRACGRALLEQVQLFRENRLDRLEAQLILDRLRQVAAKVAEVVGDLLSRRQQRAVFVTGCLVQLLEADVARVEAAGAERAERGAEPLVRVGLRRLAADAHAAKRRRDRGRLEQTWDAAVPPLRCLLARGQEPLDRRGGDVAQPGCAVLLQPGTPRPMPPSSVSASSRSASPR
jgi:hypothetical protein